MERVGQKLAPLFDQTKAYSSGSTLPVKVQLLDANGGNLSSSTIPLSIRSIKLIGQPTLANVVSPGNGTSDTAFRYDSTVPGYIYNLSLKNYAPGRYAMSIFAGADHNFFYNVEFQVR
jgi:hypothetical protein